MNPMFGGLVIFQNSCPANVGVQMTFTSTVGPYESVGNVEICNVAANASEGPVVVYISPGQTVTAIIDVAGYGTGEPGMGGYLVPNFPGNELAPVTWQIESIF